MTPLDVIEFQLELLAFNTRPRIVFQPGSRSPVRKRGLVLELPPVWWQLTKPVRVFNRCSEEHQ